MRSEYLAALAFVVVLASPSYFSGGGGGVALPAGCADNELIKASGTGGEMECEDSVTVSDAGLLLGAVDITMAAVTAGVDQIKISADGLVVTTDSVDRLTVTDAAVTLTVPFVRAAVLHHLDMPASSIQQGAGSPGRDATAGCLALDLNSEILEFQFHVPTDWNASSDMTLDIHWHPEAGDALADGETVIFSATWRTISHGVAVDNGTAVTATVTRTQSGAGLDKVHFENKITLDHDDSNQPMAVGDMVFVSFFRDFTADTYTGDAAVCDFDIAYFSQGIPEH